MKSYGVTFTADMVRAILEGRKCQTRRVIEKIDKYKNIRVGDEIYVKEAWQTRENLDHLKPSELSTECEILYRAGDIPIPLPRKWRSGMFMPEWASRIRRTVTATRVERLHKISVWDIQQEGVVFPEEYRIPLYDCSIEEQITMGSPFGYMKKLWNSINARRGYSWETNPMVRVIEWENE